MSLIAARIVHPSIHQPNISRRLIQLAYTFQPITVSILQHTRVQMSSVTSSTSIGISFTPPKNDLFQLHQHARKSNKFYPTRAPVPDEKVHWNVGYADYKPPEFTTEGALKRSKDLADPSKISNLASRPSYEMSPLPIDPDTHRPLNPYGRTGLSGRGKLYNWGPNHAADPIVTRSSSSDPDLVEVIVIQRGDTGSWAFPGGMVDPGEEPEQSLQREFEEEALNVPEEKKEEAKAVLKKVFKKGTGRVVYQGYIDDPRNTDNAWMESYCMHYHLDPSLAAELTPLLTAGDDAKAVRWLLAKPNEADYQALYGSHRLILERAIKLLKENTRK